MLEGDLSKLYEPGGNYVAAVYSDNDYGEAEMDSHWDFHLDLEDHT